MATSNPVLAESSRSPSSDLSGEFDLEKTAVKLSDLEQQARAMIREQPVVSVLAAAGLGYVIARLVSRSAR